MLLCLQPIKTGHSETGTVGEDDVTRGEPTSCAVWDLHSCAGGINPRPGTDAEMLCTHTKPRSAVCGASRSVVFSSGEVSENLTSVSHHCHRN